jgi:hypothetical protein
LQKRVIGEQYEVKNVFQGIGSAMDAYCSEQKIPEKIR